MTTAHRIYGRLGFERAEHLDWSPVPGFPPDGVRPRDVAVKAVVLESYGEPEVLRVAEVPEPAPGPTR